MDRVCINKITGKLIEMQAGGDDNPDLMKMRLDTLRKNALNAGYEEENIEVRWVTEEELSLLMAPTKEELEQLAFEKENADLMEHLKENDIKSIRAIREWIIGASQGMVSALRIYDVVAQQGRDRLNEIKISKV